MSQTTTPLRLIDSRNGGAGSASTQAESIPAADPSEIYSCLQVYFRSQSTVNSPKLARRFHPGARLCWCEPDGEAGYLPHQTWQRAHAPQKSGLPATVRNVQWLDHTRHVCVAKIASYSQAATAVEYVALAKYGSSWRIVARVMQPAGGTAPLSSRRSADRRQIEALLATKFQAIDARNDTLLARACFPQALAYHVDEHEPIGIPIGEWIARCDHARRSGFPIKPARREIRQIDSVGAIGYAKFTQHLPDAITAGYVLLRKSHHCWRIISLLVTPEASQAYPDLSTKS